MYNAAWYAWTKGNATEAVQLSRMSMEVRKKIRDQEHKETLRSMGMVSLAYDSGGSAGGSRGAGGGSDGDQEEGAGRGASTYADQHE